ncbi:MAG: YIP1 family protein [Dehalococcoidia bacterium]|nr:YIP1 family protein [Dehalococcoidia bacterium]
MAAHASLLNRMMRAARLQPALYEEVEADTSATGQALLVVILVSAATGIVAGFEALAFGGGVRFFYGLLYGVATAITGWLIWALFAYVVGITILKGPQTSSTWGELLRTMGFASTPELLRIFAVVPGIGGVIAIVGSVWRLLATIIAVRQALDFSTWRGIIVTLIGWILYMVLISLIGLLASGTTPTVL